MNFLLITMTQQISSTLILISILTIIPFFGFSQILGNKQSPTFEDASDQWDVSVEAISYLYNYEWFQRHGAAGYTLFGSIAPVYAHKRLNSQVTLDLGAVGFIKYGSDVSNTVKPLFRINIDLTEEQNLILGTINQSHEIHQGLNLDTDFYQQQLAQGIEYLNYSQANNIDIWVNWKIAESVDTAEYFEVGSIYNKTYLKNEHYHLFSNIQAFITHKDGQITQDESFIRGTWTQTRLGGIVKDNELSIALLTSKYRDDEMDRALSSGLQLSYKRIFQMSEANNIHVYANHFINNDFYNPNAHTGYNQNSFTNFSIESNWIRADELSISTGLSLDWINGSFSTTQYLNVSLIAK